MQDLESRDLGQGSLAAVHSKGMYGSVKGDCTEGACSCRYKGNPREEAFQKDLQKRLSRAIGQLNGVKNMIEDNRYCADVLIQLAAAESAVHRVSELLLENHMQTCVVDQIRQGNDEVIEEAMALIRRYGGR